MDRYQHPRGVRESVFGRMRFPPDKSGVGYEEPYRLSPLIWKKKEEYKVDDVRLCVYVYSR